LPLLLTANGSFPDRRPKRGLLDKSVDFALRAPPDAVDISARDALHAAMESGVIPESQRTYVLELLQALGPAADEFVVAGAQAMKFMVAQSRATKVSTLCWMW